MDNGSIWTMPAEINLRNNFMILPRSARKLADVTIHYSGALSSPQLSSSPSGLPYNVLNVLNINQNQKAN